jgi:hypothetical protein
MFHRTRDRIASPLWYPGSSPSARWVGCGTRGWVRFCGISRKCTGLQIIFWHLVVTFFLRGLSWSEVYDVEKTIEKEKLKCKLRLKLESINMFDFHLSCGPFYDAIAVFG